MEIPDNIILKRDAQLQLKLFILIGIFSFMIDNIEIKKEEYKSMFEILLIFFNVL
jgi:hypothetical protein